MPHMKYSLLINKRYLGFKRILQHDRPNFVYVFGFKTIDKLF